MERVASLTKYFSVDQITMWFSKYILQIKFLFFSGRRKAAGPPGEQIEIGIPRFLHVKAGFLTSPWLCTSGGELCIIIVFFLIYHSYYLSLERVEGSNGKCLCLRLLLSLSFVFFSHFFFFKLMSISDISCAKFFYLFLDNVGNTRAK